LEFGNAIPLFFLTLCCAVTTPIIGVVALVYIRFSLKDTQLAKAILLSVLIVSLLWFAYPIVQLLVATTLIPSDCPGTEFRITPDILGMTLRYASGLLIPGVVSGFLLAFVVVTPITLLVRHLRSRSNMNDQAP